MRNSDSQNPSRGATEIDLVRHLVQLWRKRFWIAGYLFLGVVAAAVYVWQAPVLYRAQTVVSVASPEDATVPTLRGNLGGLAALAGISLAPNGNIEEALAIMRSREFSQSFIEEHDLKPRLFPRKWDEVGQSWAGREPTMAEAYDRFNNDVRAISQDKRTGLITVSIVWPDPVEAARLANALTEKLNREMRARAIQRTDASLNFLKTELEKTAAIEIKQSINRLMESQINQRMYANVTEEFALRVVDRGLPPDPRDAIGPGKLLVFGLGALLGALLGCCIILGIEIFHEVRSQLRNL